MKKLFLSILINTFFLATTPVFGKPDIPTLGSKETNIQSAKSSLPHGFVYLDEIDSTIRQSLRYYGDKNFIGHSVDGYLSSRVILTRKAAEALSKAQALLKKDGYSFVIYDAYRPQTAVNSFMDWSKDPNDQKMKTWFYPRVDKSRVFEQGYVAEKSGHSRGSTIDLSIIPIKMSLYEVDPQPRKLRDGFEILFLDDGTVDMGSSFDLFDKASHYENDLISEEHQKRRQYLKQVMESCGFKNYAEEWWHFTLKDEPFPDTYFDFPVE